MPVPVVRSQRAAEVVHVLRREIEALGAGRRHDVGGIAGEEQPAVLHRRRHEAAQRRDALLDRWPGRDVAAPAPREAALELVPDPLVGPVLDLLVEAALDVVAAAGRRAHRGEREAALVAGVDQLVRARRHVGQDAEPAERIDALERPADATPARLARLTPWKPSQPAMKSQTSSRSTPACGS